MTDYEREIARHLGIPPVIIMSIRRNEWGAVRNYAQRRWNTDGYKAFKAYQNGVERIVKEFSTLVKNPIPVNFEQKKRLALYVKNIGVAPLIDDMRFAVAKNSRIRSINYFLKDHEDGQTSRWGMLYFNHIEKEHNQKKVELKKIDERLAQYTGFVLKMDAPEWLISAEKRLAELRLKRLRSSTETQELKTLEARLYSHRNRVK